MGPTLFAFWRIIYIHTCREATWVYQTCHLIFKAIADLSPCIILAVGCQWKSYQASMTCAGFGGQPVMLPNGAVVDSQRLPRDSVLETPVRVNESAMLESIRSAPGSARPRPGRFSGGELRFGTRRHSSSSRSQTSSQTRRSQASSQQNRSRARHDRTLLGFPAAVSDLSDNESNALLQGRVASVTDSLGSMVGARVMELESGAEIQDYSSEPQGLSLRPQIPEWEAAESFDGHRPIGSGSDVQSGMSEAQSVHFHPIRVPENSDIAASALTGKICSSWCLCSLTRKIIGLPATWQWRFSCLVVSIG